jgi:DNA-binding NarL/FixJ family response regulator
MPGINGIETTRIICEKYPETKIIILTVYREDQYVTEAIQAGARGYILKDVKRADLVKTVHHVMENKAVIDPVVTTGLFDQIKKEKQGENYSAKPNLTIRELEILVCLTEGDKDREISKKLHISEHTVRSHIKNLYKKLGVTSRSRAVVKGIQFKFVSEIGKSEKSDVT